MAEDGNQAHLPDALTASDGVLTDDLLKELLEGPNMARFAQDVPDVAYDLPAYLNSLLKEKGRRRIDVVHAADLNETFGYQIFTGTRKPSRDKVIQIAFGMPCTLRETQLLLKHAGCNELYVKNRRDAIIVFCLANGMTLAQTEEELFRFGQRTIVSEQ